MQWLELSVETEAAAIETVSALLHEYGEGGVAVYQHIVPDDEDAAYHYDTDRPTIVATYVLATADGDRRHAAIEVALGHLRAFDLARIGPVVRREVDEEDWANAWKRFYHPMRFGRRTVIKPSWRDYTPGPDDLVIELDPGMAFGTGLHQTTALCLELLEDVIAPGDVVLDQGTGSGILALAAARLGAARVVGVDNSEVAVIAANANAARNGVFGIVQVYWGQTVPGDPAPGDIRMAPGPAEQALDEAERPPRLDDAPLLAPYDVVVANIIANVIIALASRFAAVLKPGGMLVASGIIREREDEVRAALGVAGFSVARREGRDEWVALTAQLRA